MKILLIQEHPILIAALKLTLQSKGHYLEVSDGNSNPHALIDRVNPDVVIADITLGNGIRYIEEAKHRNVPAMVISSSENQSNLQLAFDKGADDYINLPVSLTEVALRIYKLVRTRLPAAA